MTTRCTQCEWRPFVASLQEPDGPPGFQPLPNFAGYVKRCASCSASDADYETCVGCGHPKTAHYVGSDPEYPGFKSSYCDHEGCMCWERFCIARPAALTKLTPERKPKREVS